MLYYTEIFFHNLIFDVSRFSRLCSQIRFIAKRKEIDAKSVYLNFGSDKVAALPILYTYSGTYYKVILFSQGKKNCW